jgi:valyl-tRNA synthetase
MASHSNQTQSNQTDSNHPSSETVADEKTRLDMPSVDPIERKFEVPSSYDHALVEEKWKRAWAENQVYRWDPSRPKEENFVVDTPPPTVSGSLHIGHTFSYTQTDILVRHMRMMGKNIMYPMGWDDNGLPTERRVQNRFGISCDPLLPLDPNWRPTVVDDKDARELVKVSRENFIQACSLLTVEDERAFKELWQRLGLSVEWNQEYSTVGKQCREISQRSFIDLYKKGFMYQETAPTIWDVSFQTAVAQAELEDRDMRGHFHDIRFTVEGGQPFVISTTRPELLGACIAVVAHPDDVRFKDLFGQTAITPLFGTQVPILPSEHADPAKGSGIMMVCTFGDLADVTWWRGSKLPARPMIGKDGRIIDLAFGPNATPSIAPDRANEVAAALTGLTVSKAREKIVEMLRDPNLALDGLGATLMGEPRPITQAVKFYEKGDKPVEFVASRQWYIRITDFKEEFLEQGRKIEWYPEHMRTRYEHWVNGLNNDWCISRQRFFGVPFPVWYPIGADGNPNFTSPILATEEMLPVDPLSQCPPGYTESDRNRPGGFCGDPDVMDTWATSSLTPQIVSQWGTDPSRHERLFPMNLRPQSHEIIRTWTFYTIAKAWMHHREIPWKQVAVSGWILDPERKKMSKSKGNVVTPSSFLEKYSADAVRYWTARAKLGIDTAFDEKVFEAGRKVSNKLFNAGRFVLSQLQAAGIKGQLPPPSDITHPLDIAWSARLQRAVQESSKCFQALDYAGALASIESVFWDFCDNYLELVKIRSYEKSEEGSRSALSSLGRSMDITLRLFAPFLPYVTEEIWQHFHPSSRFHSIHVAKWPQQSELGVSSEQESSYSQATAIIREVRKEKAKIGKGIGTPIGALTITAAPKVIAQILPLAGDIARAARVEPNGLALIESSEDAEGEHLFVSIEL